MGMSFPGVIFMAPRLLGNSNWANNHWATDNQATDNWATPTAQLTTG